MEDTVCPSDITCTVKGKEKQARALTIVELHQIQHSFVSAAERAVKAGYDGVEIHACHNYLISQFYNTLVNRRTDVYGKQPSLFALEVIREIRRRVPESFVIGVRLGAFEPTLADSIAHAVELEEKVLIFWIFPMGLSRDPILKSLKIIPLVTAFTQHRKSEKEFPFLFSPSEESHPGNRLRKFCKKPV